MPRSLWLLWILVPFLVFVSTVQGRIAYWDTAEMQTVPWIFGIPHPTGFPAFVLLGGAFAHLFPLGTVAWRISFFCAMLTLGCAAIVYSTIANVTKDRWTAVCAAWLLAFGLFFWVYGVRAEIHAMAAFFAALVLFFALRAFYDAEISGYYAAALAFGCGLATHPIVLFVLPSLLLLAGARGRVFSARRALICVLLAAAPLASYAYLPLRSHAIVSHGLDPAVALGKPPGGAIWNTDNPQTLHGFVRLVTGADFKAGTTVLNMADIPAYGDKIGTFGSTLYREFTPVGTIVALICFSILFARRAVVASALLLAVVLPAAFAMLYPPVVEIERYFFIPMIAFALAIGLGITAVSEPYRNLLRVPIFGAAVFLLVGNYPEAQLRSVYGSEALIARVRAITPSNAIVIADWTRGTSLAYAAYVNGDLRGRTIDIAWPFQDVQYLPRWLAARPVYYVGRRVIRSRRIFLCAVSSEFPIYTVHLVPGHC